MAVSEVRKYGHCIFPKLIIKQFNFEEKGSHLNITFLNWLNKFFIRYRFDKKVDFQRWVWIAFMFYVGSVFPAQSRCPPFTFYFIFICILLLLSKYIWELCQTLLNPHPLDVSAELSLISKLAFYSGLQLEMQVNKVWELILFGMRTDPEAKRTLEISQPRQAGACWGGEEQLQQAGGAWGTGASSHLGGRNTSALLPVGHPRTARTAQQRLYNSNLHLLVLSSKWLIRGLWRCWGPWSQAAQVQSYQQGSPSSHGHTHCQGVCAVRSSPSMLSAHKVARGHVQNPKAWHHREPWILTSGYILHWSNWIICKVPLKLKALKIARSV